MDIVATKNIERDEEIFLDYGDAWSEAWNRHVRNWKPPPDADKYVSARELNHLQTIKTTSEGYYDANYVEQLCREHFRVTSGLTPNPEYVPYVYWGTMSNEARSSYYCRAVDRFRRKKDGETRYTVELYTRDETQNGQCRERLAEVLLSVPRDVFLFVDFPYTREYVQYDPAHGPLCSGLLGNLEH